MMFPSKAGYIIAGAYLAGMPTLTIATDLGDERKRQALIRDLKQFAQINGMVVNIRLAHKMSSKPMSMIKDLTLPDNIISRMLGMADSVISPNYTKSPPGQGIPFEARIKAIKAFLNMSIRDIVKKAMSGDKQSPIHNRRSYMEAANKALDVPVMRGNDIYGAFRKLITT